MVKDNKLRNDEEQQLFAEINQTEAEYEWDKTIHELFEEQVKRSPESTAVVFKDKQITYMELNARSNQLAGKIRQYGIKPDMPVGIMIERSIEMIVAILGVLKAGGAYLPIDTEYPKERINLLVKDSHCEILVTDDSTIEKLEFLKQDLKFLINANDESLYTGNKENPVAINRSSNLAYIIYTSGSTGRPKGVMIEHHGIANIKLMSERYFEITKADKMLQFASSSFDLSVWEIFSALLLGAQLHVISKDVMNNYQNLKEYITEHEISCAGFTPNYLENMDTDIGNTIRTLLVGGASSNTELVNRWKDKVRYINAYGPTEVSICSTLFICDEAIENYKNIPIGRPINNTRVYVLNDKLECQSIGKIGELCISGVGLARGYLYNEALTNERFIDNPYEPGKKMYKTGDLVQWLPDGNLEFVGRIDQQVKIRGFRIELGEIESTIRNMDKIKEIVVIDRENNKSKYLCAYYVSDREYEVDEFKAILEQTLPDYMIPSYFIKIEKIPLTINRKLDRSKLPDPYDKAWPETQLELPCNSLEEKLLSIWKRSLAVEQIGINDHFTNLGGESLKAIHIVSKIKEEMNVAVSLKQLFHLDTIKNLAEYIEHEVQEVLEESYLAGTLKEEERYEPFPLTGIQLAYLLGRDENFELGGAASKLTAEFEVDVDLERFQGALNKLIRRHPILNLIIDEDGTQHISDGSNHYHLKALDLRTLSEKEIEEKIWQQRQVMLAEDIDPYTWPLFRLEVFILGDTRNYFFLNMDPLIGDDSSLKILIRDFKALYENQDSMLPKLEYTFRDYVIDLIKFKESSLYRRDERFWLNHIDDFPSAPNLPMKCNPGDITYPSFLKLSSFLNREQWEALKQRAKEKNVTVSSLLCAAYAYILAFWSNENRFSINLTVFNRIPFHEDVKNIVGDFTTLILLAIESQKNEVSFWDFVWEVQDTLLDALEHRHYDGLDFIRNIGKKNNANSSAVMPIVFTSGLNDSGENTFDELIDFGKMKFYSTRTSQVYIDNQVYELNGGLFITWDYVEQLFEKQVIETMFHQYSDILAQVLAGDCEIELKITQEDQEQIESYNQTDKELTVLPLHQSVSIAASKNPQKEALRYHDHSMSYQELDAKSNQIAWFLSSLKIEKGDYVGVIAKRSIETIVNVLGIIKAGAAYIPLDPDYPEERIKYIEEKSNCKFFLTKDSYEREGIGGYSAEQFHSDAGLDDIAYAIFTSGSTGNPKGAILTHGAAANTIQEINALYSVSEQDKIMGISSLCFDLSVYDVFGALSSGATLVIIDDQRDVYDLKRVLETERITIWNSVPAIMGLLVDCYEENRVNHCLRLVLLSGDWIPLALPQKIKNVFTEAEVISLGGATEGAIWSIYYPIEEVKESWNSIPYGRPLANQKFYVLSGTRQLSPVGVKGELYIGGMGVAQGYLNDEQKTKEAFIHHKTFGYIYKTGDYGVLKKDGYIEFLGREDSQIKIRGYRVELGEIENSLLSHGAVEQAVVLDHTLANNAKCIYAFVVLNDDTAMDVIDAHLRKLLPVYMIPARYIPVDQVPLTANGKVNKAKLKKIAEQTREEKAEIKRKKEPVNDTQRNILQVWQDVLSQKEIGIEQSYYELGADSLKIVSILTEINKKLNIKVPISEIFKHQTIESLSGFIGGMQEKASKDIMEKAIHKLEKREYYKTSPAQKRMYTLAMLGNTGAAYDIPMVLLLVGRLEIDRFADAFQRVIDRHEILRTGFEIVDNELMQKVYDDMRLTIDFRKMKKNETERIGLEKLAGMECKRLEKEFELARPSLLRSSLVELQKDRYLFSVNFHHIIADGISQEIFINDLLDLYHGKKLPELCVQYKDYAAWYEDYGNSTAAKQAEEYWLNIFKVNPASLSLPYDFKKPPVRSYRGKNVYFRLNQTLTRKIKTVAKELNATLYMVMLSAYYILLYKYTNESDIVIGSVSSGRMHKDLQEMFGMFVNTVALRGNVDGTKTFQEFLLEIKEFVIASLEYSNYDFDKLVQKLNYEKDYSENPLFSTMFVVEDTSLFDKEQGELRFSTLLFERDSARLDIALAAVDDGDEIILNVEYSTDLFRSTTIERMMKHYINILSAVSELSEDKLDEIDMVGEDEKKSILSYCQGRLEDAQKDATIQELFEEQVEKSSECLAVVFKDKHLTYRELNEKANQLARKIRQYNIKPDMVVGIMLDRSMEMIIAILAVLKAGGAYLPIDLEYPIDRIRYLIEDSGCKMLLVDDSTITKIDTLEYDDFTIVNVNDVSIYTAEKGNLVNRNSSRDLAYIIYTSGSTGKPKGVMIEHKGIGNIKVLAKQDIQLSQEDRILQVASISFDISVGEIFVALLTGAQLHVLSKDIINSYHLMEQYIMENQITFAAFTPNYLANLDSKVAATLKTLLTGGSAANMELIRKWCDKVRYINGYGPTEVTICSNIYICDDKLSNYRSVPIGAPISNTKGYILNSHLQCQPIGVVGELYLSGIGLARGYLNRPKLTDEKFITNPFEPDEKMYATGDLVRLTEDGNIEYIGRADNQVKVRGYRIELGEIEAQLMKNDEVKDAVAITRKDNFDTNYICAYITPQNRIEQLHVSEIAKQLQSELPEYMVPSFLIPMETIPMTTNGKVDAGKLPMPRLEKMEVDQTQPQDALEESLVQIWKEILNVQKVGTKSNFFHLGGHSLNAIILASRILKEIGVEISLERIFRNPTVKDIAEYIRSADKDTKQHIVKARVQEYYEASSPQKRIYISNQVEEGITYNMPLTLEITGDFDMEKCKRILQQLVNRHESLRTEFFISDGVLMQRIKEDISFNVAETILLGETQEQRMESFIEPFSLDCAPLFRAEICKAGENKYLLLMDMHHIISDGISLNILMREFEQLYGEKELTPLNLQYKDYSQWRQSDYYLEKNSMQKKYWMNLFHGEIPVLDLPVDHPRTKEQSFAGSKVKMTLEHELTQSLLKYARDNGVTMYMLYLAAYGVMLSKYTGQEDIVIGTPSAGRRDEDLENIVGMFVNTLAMRSRPCFNKTFTEYLQEVRQMSLEAFENQDYQFDELVEDLNIKREISRNPLFDTMLVYEDNTNVLLSLDDLRIQPLEPKHTTSKFDVTITINESAESTNLEAEYATALFEKATIERMLLHFTGLLEKLVRQPQQSLGELSIITDFERTEILHEFHQEDDWKTAEGTITALFEAMMNQVPDRIAAVYEKERLSYRELNERATSLAGLLRQKGVESNIVVGIMVERSLEMIVGMMAILKAGGAYLPIDPRYPEDRINYMVTNSGAFLVLTQEKISGKLTFPIETIYLDQPAVYMKGTEYIKQVNQSGDLAYIIYTSGTTGRPKGIKITHSNVRNLVEGLREAVYVNYHTPLKTALLASYVFDASVQQIFASLLLGNTLYIVPEEERKDGKFLMEYYIRHGIEVSDGTPMHLSMIANTTLLNHPEMKIRHFIIGGDKLSKKVAEKILTQVLDKRTVICNVYGPTECCVDATYYNISLGNIDQYDVIPIGRPIKNNRVYIADHNNLCPVGIAGELCISGIGLGKGYVNQDDLTDQVFVDNPFEPGQKMYRTGDLAKWLPDGTILFLGRIDQQVKIRGYRIELAEIEKQMLRLAGLSEAAVIDRSGGEEKYLCAYYVSEKEFEVGVLRESLQKFLPDYMLPSYFIKLDKIPLTINGKLDRGALPEPGKDYSTGTVYAAPETKRQKDMIAIWESVLGTQYIGIHDDFFHLGGDSIKALQVVSKAKEKGYFLTVKNLFKNTTVKQLCESQGVVNDEIDQGVVEGVVSLTPMQLNYFRNKEERNHNNQSFLLHQKERFAPEILRKAFQKIMDHHDALRMIYSENGEGNILQYNRNILEEPFDWTVEDLRGAQDVAGEIEAKATSIQKSMDIFAGKLVKLGIFQTEKGDYLLIAINHLVVDGVSFRIIIEDFIKLYHQALKGDELKLEKKTSAFRDYVGGLKKYADSGGLLKEDVYWQQLISTQVKAVPMKKRTDAVTYRGAKTLTVSMNQEETDNLVRRTNRAYGTQINDILLTALTLAMEAVTSEKKIKVYMEGHGREDVLEGIDTSRTVGWFTTIYPVVIDLEFAEQLPEMIKTTKETLRRIPNHGIGFGLKHDLQGIDLLFNYFGEVGGGGTVDDITVTSFSPGESVGKDVLRSASIEINGIILAGQLTIHTTYDVTMYDEAVISKLVNSIKEKLKVVIDHCINKKTVERTPSDYGDPDLTMEQLVMLENKFEDKTIQKIYALNNMQKGMLFHSLKDSNSNAYIEQIVIDVSGFVDFGMFTKIVNEVINRHEMLRSLFEYEIIEEGRQIVLAHSELSVEYYDLGRVREKEKWMEEYLLADLNRGFVLDKEIPIRISLIKQRENMYQVVWTHHHMILDGWSMGIIMEDFFAVYEAVRNGQRIYTAPRQENYSEYLRWLKDQENEEVLSYWEGYLKGYHQEAKIPKIDRKAGNQNYLRKERSLELSAGMTERISRLTVHNKVTMSTFVQLLWGILLSKYNRTEDVVFGTVISGRENKMELLDKTVGLLINTIPVRIKIRGEGEFCNILKTCQADNVNNSKYGFLNLSKVQSVSALKNNLIDHVLVFENYSFNQDILKGNCDYNFKITDVQAKEQTNYDFNLVIIPGERITFKMIYDGTSYDEKIIDGIASHLLYLIEQIVKNERIKIAELDIITETEKEQLITRYNHTSTGYPKSRTIHEIFRQQAEKYPNHTALLMNGETLTYKELNEKANQTAALLRAKGVREGDVVALLYHRSQEMIISILGVLKSGAAYLPIDPETPADRGAFMLKDSKAKVLLTEEQIPRGYLTDMDIAVLNKADSAGYQKENPDWVSQSGRAAYIMYTSGSTGTPKGVTIHHYSVTRVVKHTNYIRIKEDDRIMQLSNYSFDGSVFDIFGALLNGASLLLIDKAILMDINRLADFIKREKVTIAFVTTALFNTIVTIAPDCLKQLRKILFGGERVSVKHVKKAYEILGKNRIIHVYGPTESTVYATYYPVNEIDEEMETIPIGKPISNTEVYVMDDIQNVVPYCVEGELCIAGDGLGDGYLNNRALTEEKFKRNPYRPGERLYRTGDLVKMLPDGNIVFIGRIDGQVKIRGHRVELGEIESELLKIENIREASVITKIGKDKIAYICAYIVGEKEMDTGKIVSYLSNRLPKYMIPSFFINMEELPLTLNGKVDKSALLDTEHQSVSTVKYEAPRNSVEKKLLEIWKEMVGDHGFGINDNFFEIGGDSLKAMHAINVINKVFLAEVTVEIFFSNLTIKSLGTYITGMEENTSGYVEESI